MKQNRRRISAFILILGMSFLAIGLATDNKTFTWVAVGFVIVALVSSGRRLKPRGRK